MFLTDWEREKMNCWVSSNEREKDVEFEILGVEMIINN